MFPPTGDTFLAAVKVSEKGPLEIRQIRSVTPLAGQVLVKMEFATLCRSQLMEIRGLRGHDHFIPHLIGHEGSGIVLEKGAGVTKVKVGDRVILSWIGGNGLDAPPPRYIDQNGQEINSGKCTVFNELAIVAEKYVTKIPPNLDSRVASFFGCAFTTGIGMAKRLLPTIASGRQRTHAVFGLGGVGAGALLQLCFSYQKSIVVFEKNDARLDLVKKLQAEGFPVKVAIADELESANQKFDFCIETAGSASSIMQAFGQLDTKGSLVFASHPPKGEMINIDPYELIQGKTIFGTWGGEMNPQDALNTISPRMTDFLNKNLIPDVTFSLEEINTIFDDYEKGLYFRPMIQFSSRET